MRWSAPELANAKREEAERGAARPGMLAGGGGEASVHITNASSNTTFLNKSLRSFHVPSLAAVVQARRHCEQTRQPRIYKTADRTEVGVWVRSLTPGLVFFPGSVVTVPYSYECESYS